MRTSALAVACIVLWPLGARAETGATALQTSYAETVGGHVKAESKKAGGFLVHDDVLKKDWKLKMLKIHTDRIVELGQDRFFACADLQQLAGKKTKLDLDFYVKKEGDRWVMEKVLVHKVAGKLRYTYNDKNEIVPVP